MMALTSGDLIVIRGDLIIDRYGCGGGRSDAGRRAGNSAIIVPVAIASPGRKSDRWLSRALMTSSASPPGPGHSDELAAAAAVRRRGIGLVDGATVITDHLGHIVGGIPASG